MTKRTYGADAVEAAFYDLVHDYEDNGKKGAQALGAVTGINGDVLNHKANPHMDHQPTVPELRRCMTASKDIRPLQAMNNEQGLIAIKKPEIDDVSDKDFFDLFAKLDSSKSGFSTSFSQAVADNVITSKEKEIMDAWIAQAMQSWLEFQESINAYVVDGTSE